MLLSGDQNIKCKRFYKNPLVYSCLQGNFNNKDMNPVKLMMGMTFILQVIKHSSDSNKGLTVELRKGHVDFLDLCLYTGQNFHIFVINSVKFNSVQFKPLYLLPRGDFRRAWSSYIEQLTPPTWDTDKIKLHSLMQLRIIVSMFA